MNRGELITVISQKTGVSKTGVTKVLDEFNDTVISALKKGRDVKIAGFGTFYTKDRKARLGRNPKTGEKVSIPSRTVPKFRAGKVLKDTL